MFRFMRGMPQPIMRQQIVADNIHGETGLDGPVFEPLTRQGRKYPRGEIHH